MRRCVSSLSGSSAWARCQLAAAADDAGEHHVAHVCGRDDQHERDQSEQKRQEHRREAALTTRDQCAGLDLDRRVQLRCEFARDDGCRGLQFLLRPFARDTVAETADQRQRALRTIGVPAIAEHLPGIADGNPDVDRRADDA